MTKLYKAPENGSKSPDKSAISLLGNNRSLILALLLFIFLSETSCMWMREKTFWSKQEVIRLEAKEACEAAVENARGKLNAATEAANEADGTDGSRCAEARTLIKEAQLALSDSKTACSGKVLKKDRDIKKDTQEMEKTIRAAVQAAFKRITAKCKSAPEVSGAFDAPKVEPDTPASSTRRAIPSD